MHTDTTSEPEIEVEQSETRATNYYVGISNDNHNGIRCGYYPAGLDPEAFVGTLRSFVGRGRQYVFVVGDLQGHAVYRTLNEGNPEGQLASMPWDEFIERTEHLPPQCPGSVQEPPESGVTYSHPTEGQQQPGTQN